MEVIEEITTTEPGDIVKGSESLYRVVKRSRPDCITANNRVSPALFKDTNGVSVDRDGGRNEGDIVRFITEVTFPKRTKAIASLYASNCYDAGAKVKAAPSEVNPYHANIYLDSDEEKGNLQALQLADTCQLIYFAEDVKWTGKAGL